MTAVSGLTSPELKPLSARSVVLSLMLGAHPRPMTSRELSSAGEHFGIPVSTMRVALTRAVAAGEVLRGHNDYRLGERLITRQLRQDEAVKDAEKEWNGEWELAVVVVTGRPGTERAALRDRLMTARLAELREGVWMRPANLQRAPSYTDESVLSTFRSVPDENPVEITNHLWDLRGWAAEGHAWLHRLSTTSEPAARLAVAAQLVRHLSSDPLLPPALRPRDWPGEKLRTAYAAYQAELRGESIGPQKRRSAS